MFLLCGVFYNFQSVFTNVILYDSCNYFEGKKDNAVIPNLYLRKPRETCPRAQRVLTLFIGCAVLCVLISYASTGLFWEKYIVLREAM